MQNATVKPFLRWAGSKRKSIGRLAAFWKPSFRRYVEPFTGSGCLFFGLRAETALLSDFNSELIETYEVLRDDPDELYTSLTALPRNSSTYYHERSRIPSSLTKFDRAVRFLYLNRNCFNGIFRTNQKGEFNVPFAGERVSAYPTLMDVRECAELLSGAEVQCCDFGVTLAQCGAGDFVYLDPPYAAADRRIFAEYGPSSSTFSIADVERLAADLTAVDSKGAKFVMTYADCREARKLGEKWLSKRWAVRRQIAGFASNRRMAYELIITNIEGIL